MSIFNINFIKLASDMLPVRLRVEKIKAFALAAIRALVNLYSRFMANRDKNIYEVTHNAQVVYLQAVLNDQFDSSLRRITIVDAERIEPVFIYRRAEQKPVYIYTRGEANPVYIYRRIEMTKGGAFVVHVPIALSGLIDIVLMRALIDKYRLAGKANYKIIFI